MAEPAYQLPEEDEDQPSVIPEGSKAVTRPNLQKLEGGGDTSEPKRGHLRSVPDDAEAGLFNNDADNDESAADSSGPSKASEANDGLYSPHDRIKDKFGERAKGFLWGSKRRKRVTILSTAFGFLLGGGFYGSVLLSGPAQLLQLGHVLEVPFTSSDATSEIRTNNLFRWWRAQRTGDIGETRVGYWGSKSFASTIGKLNDIGISFERNQLTGNPREMTIDTEKLAEKYPELKEMGGNEKKAWLADKFNVTEDQLGQLVGTGGDRYVVNTQDIGIKAMRGLTKDALLALEDGKAVTFMRFRIAAEFFNAPSAFHPLKKLTASQENKYGHKKYAQQQEEERQKAVQAPLAEEAAAPRSIIKEKMSSVKAGVDKALLITAAVCAIRDVGDSVVAFNRDAIAAPTALHALDTAAVASQVRYGDASMEQVGAAVDSWYDSSGKSIWDGQALRSLQGQEGGIDISEDYKQAFSPSTTASMLKDTVGGGIAGRFACSKIGRAVQFIGALAVVVSGFFDGSLSWSFGTIAKLGIEAVVTGATIHMITAQITNLVEDKAVVPLLMSGPLGGNLLAYGAREASNINAIASGGIELSSKAAGALSAQYEEQNQKEFEARPIFARLFDTHDYRSFISRFSSSLSPSLSRNALSLLSTITNIGSVLPHVFSSLLPKAAADSSYDWPFPQYGISTNLLNDPDLQDPYDNAGKVAQFLDTGGLEAQYYSDKAKACFGVNIYKDDDNLWNIEKVTDVNPASDSYTSQGCGNTSDEMWRRIIMFIYDTDTIGAISCYSGDDTACSTVGVSNT
jgi:hypothetical protein